MAFVDRVARFWKRTVTPHLPSIKQACAIPYRVAAGQLEFCLITSIRTGRWGFPKGIIDPGETAEQAALREAFEEAGVSGRIVGPPLGTYWDEKWGARLEVAVFLMEVSWVEPHWQEARARQRRLCGADEALSLIDKPRQREAFERALARLRGSVLSSD